MFSYILAQHFTLLSFDGLCSKFVYILSVLVFDCCLASAQKNIFYTMYALHATKTSQTGRLVLVFSVHNYNHLHSIAFCCWAASPVKSNDIQELKWLHTYGIKKRNSVFHFYKQIM